MKREDIYGIIILLMMVFGFVMFFSQFASAYSLYGAPSEFGNESTTTCYVGGDDGIVNCTGSAILGGNISAETGFFFKIGELINQVQQIFAREITVTDRIYLDGSREHWISSNASELYNGEGLSEETIFLFHNETHAEGTIGFILATINRTMIWTQVGKNNSAGGLGNSWMIIPNNMSNAFLDTDGRINMTSLSNCLIVIDALGQIPRIFCDTSETGADLFVQDDIQLGGTIFAGDGIRAETIASFIMNGNDFNIFNGSLHIQTPVNFTSGFLPGDSFTSLSTTFPGTINPFTNDQDDIGNWITTTSNFCDEGECAFSTGADSGVVSMTANFNTQNVNQTELHFTYSLLNLIGSGLFSVTILNNTDSELLFSDGTDNVDKSSQSIVLDEVWNNLSSVNLTVLCDLGSTLKPTRQCFIDTVFINGTFTANTTASVNSFDSEICGGDGSRDISGNCNVGIRWDAELAQWIISGTLNATGTITGGIAGSGTATNWAKFVSTTSIGNAPASDDGSLITFTLPLEVQDDVNITGDLNVGGENILSLIGNHSLQDAYNAESGERLINMEDGGDVRFHISEASSFKITTGIGPTTHLQVGAQIQSITWQPVDDDTFDFGSVSKRWRDGYFSGEIIGTNININSDGMVRIGSNLSIGGSVNITGELNVSGNLFVLGETNLVDNVNITGEVLIESENPKLILFNSDDSTSGDFSTFRFSHPGGINLDAPDRLASIEFTDRGFGVENVVASIQAIASERHLPGTKATELQFLITQSGNENDQLNLILRGDFNGNVTADFIGNLVVGNFVGHGNIGAGGDRDLLFLESNKLTVNGALNVDGFVGIGTASPRSPLEVDGKANDEIITFTNDNMDNSGTNALYRILLKATAEREIRVSGEGSNSNWNFFFENPNAGKMNVMIDGNVGIGTDSPELKLHIGPDAPTETYLDSASSNGLLVAPNVLRGMLSVEGNSEAWLTLMAQDGTVSKRMFGIEVDGTEWFFRSINDGLGLRQIFMQGQMSTTTGDLLLQPGGGDVGIGTTNPGALLDVRGEVRSGILDNTAGKFRAVAAGSGNNGGVFQIDNSGAYDTTITAFIFQAFQDDLFIGPANDPDAFEYDGGTQIWNFNNPNGVIIDGTLKVSGALDLDASSDSQFTSTANTACSTQCGTDACLSAFDRSGIPLTLHAVACSDATADNCFCSN